MAAGVVVGTAAGVVASTPGPGGGGRFYGSPYWGWGAYYPYYGYPYAYPAYGYPGYLSSYPVYGASTGFAPQTTPSLYSNPTSGSVAPSPEEMAVSKVLTASGVANDNGRLRWPLGLQILGGPESGHQADDLRRQLDALFQEAAKQAAKGPANPELLHEITQAVDQFRDLLTRDREERGLLAGAVYDEADRFLDQLKDAEAVLRAGVKTQGARSR